MYAELPRCSLGVYLSVCWFEAKEAVETVTRAAQEGADRSRQAFDVM